MNSLFDFLTLLVIGFLALRGLRKGFIDEAIKVVSLGVSIVFSIKYHGIGLSIMKNFFPVSEGLQVVLGFLIVFIGVYLTFQVLGSILKGLVRMLKLVWVDKTLGLGFGAVKGLIVMCLVVWFVSVFPELKLEDGLKKKSVLYPVLEQVKDDVSHLFHLEGNLTKIGDSLREIFGLRGLGSG